MSPLFPGKPSERPKSKLPEYGHGLSDEEKIALVNDTVEKWKALEQRCRDGKFSVGHISGEHDAAEVLTRLGVLIGPEQGFVFDGISLETYRGIVESQLKACLEVITNGTTISDLRVFVELQENANLRAQLEDAPLVKSMILPPKVNDSAMPEK